MLKGLAKDTTTTGFATGTGLVYYNLEPQSKRLLPRPTPLRNSMARVKSPTAGPGLAANWKALVAADGGIVGAGTGQYPGISEGHRNSFMTVTERNYTATFAALGKDIPTTFEAQFAGQGFDDIRAQAQITKLNALMISEEKMILGGNAGSGAGLNGFALGTPAAPTVALVTGGSLTSGKYVSAAVVQLTYWGLQFASVAGGVVTTFVRTNADASTDTINGGGSAISPLSSTVQTTGGTLAVSATTTPVTGALGYAWYFDIESTNTTVLANATLAAITTVPTYTLTANPVGTQTGTATGLNADHSFNSLDFTGMFGWTASQGGYIKDLGGSQLTANGDGTIAEIETLILQSRAELPAHAGNHVHGRGAAFERHQQDPHLGIRFGGSGRRAAHHVREQCAGYGHRRNARHAIPLEVRGRGVGRECGGHHRYQVASAAAR